MAILLSKLFAPFMEIQRTASCWTKPPTVMSSFRGQMILYVVSKELQSKITYDPNTTQLSFLGFMTLKEKSTLTSAAAALSQMRSSLESNPYSTRPDLSSFEI